MTTYDGKRVVDVFDETYATIPFEIATEAVELESKLPLAKDPLPYRCAP